MKLSRYILPFIFLLIGIILNFTPEWNTDKESNNSQEKIQPGCPEQRIQIDNTTNLLTTRSWSTYPNFQQYCARYQSNDADYADARNFRENYSNFWYTSNGDLWGKLYQELYQREKDLLIPLVDTLLEIKNSRNLSRSEFANVVVAFVQDIPYCYIKTKDNCADREFNEFECLPNQKWGILSPVEFLHTLKGDCDTRTVLLYTLFKQLGYSPKIANSEFYLHSMLLLDLPSAGKYLQHNNQRFYFWETTASGWQIGNLPPEYGNVKHWEIVLN